MGLFDLHTHSTASDGSVSPERLPVMARGKGLSGIALTDHDTLNGLGAFLKSCHEQGIRGIAGIEISSNGPAGGEVHVLGYFVPLQNEKFVSGIRFLQEARTARNRQMIRLLRDAGCPVTMDDWEAEAGGGILGRLHLANLLLRVGWVKHIGEAFSKWIGRGGDAFVPKERWSTIQAVRFLRESGALPVLAHPGLYRGHVPDIRQFLIQLKESGLVGIECLHSDHDERQAVRFQTLAVKLGLLKTGGSDFHGEVKPHVALGHPGMSPEWFMEMEQFHGSKLPREGKL